MFLCQSVYHKFKMYICVFDVTVSKCSSVIIYFSVLQVQVVTAEEEMNDVFSLEQVMSRCLVLL